MLLGIFVFLPGVVNPKHEFTKKETTEEVLRRCEWIQMRFSGMTRADLRSYLVSKQVAGASLGQIFNAMLLRPQDLPTNSISIDMPTIKDAWGHPLNCMWFEQAVTHGASDQLRRKQLPVLVWSSGANGTNEFGSGDDVVAH